MMLADMGADVTRVDRIPNVIGVTTHLRQPTY
ncbi:MAG: hypothetical protein QOD92_3258 [Acidimicrobiaceae bacterium]|jgi:hypothetical protein